MIYGERDSDEARKAVKRQMLIVYALIAVGVALCAAGLIVRIRPLAIFGLIVFCMLAYFWYDMKAAPWRKYARYLADIKAGRAHESTGVVNDVGNTVRRSEEGVAIRDVSLADSNGEKTLFYWDDAKPLPDMIGKSVHVTAYGRYITGVDIV